MLGRRPQLHVWTTVRYDKLLWNFGVMCARSEQVVAPSRSSGNRTSSSTMLANQVCLELGASALSPLLKLYHAVSSNTGPDLISDRFDRSNPKHTLLQGHAWLSLFQPSMVQYSSKAAVWAAIYQRGKPTLLQHIQMQPGGCSHRSPIAYTRQ